MTAVFLLYSSKSLYIVHLNMALWDPKVFTFATSYESIINLKYILN